MKKCILILSALLAAFPLWSQNKVADRIYQKYSSRDSVTSVVITKSMFQLFANVDNPNDDDFLRTVKNLDFIRILSVEDDREKEGFFKETLEQLSKENFKELMTIRETGSEVRFMTSEKDGVIHDLIMLSLDKEESSMIWMAGIIDMKTVSKIAKGMQINGMENLEKMEKKE